MVATSTNIGLIHLASGAPPGAGSGPAVSGRAAAVAGALCDPLTGRPSAPARRGGHAAASRCSQPPAGPQRSGKHSADLAALPARHGARGPLGLPGVARAPRTAGARDPAGHSAHLAAFPTRQGGQRRSAGRSTESQPTPAEQGTQRTRRPSRPGRAVHRPLSPPPPTEHSTDLPARPRQARRFTDPAALPRPGRAALSEPLAALPRPAGRSVGPAQLFPPGRALNGAASRPARQGVSGPRGPPRAGRPSPAGSAGRRSGRPTPPAPRPRPPRRRAGSPPAVRRRLRRSPGR